MKLWIARDKNGVLALFDDVPTQKNGIFYDPFYDVVLMLPKKEFPEVTFENSPQEVELKLCHQIETIKMEDCNPKARPCVLTNHGIDTNVVKFD
jgi:hypothetical protein